MFCKFSALLYGSQHASDADLCRAEVADLVDFKLCIDLAAVFADGAHFIGRDRVDAAAERYKLDELRVFLLGDVFRSTVHTRVVGPLIENVYLGRVGQLPYRVLGNNDKSERRDELIDAVVDLGVNVIRTACDDRDIKTVLVGVANGLLTLQTDGGAVFLLRLIGGIGCLEPALSRFLSSW